MLLGTLGASLLGNILTSREINKQNKQRNKQRINRGGKSKVIKRAGEGIVRAGYGSGSSKMDF